MVNVYDPFGRASGCDFDGYGNEDVGRDDLFNDDAISPMTKNSLAIGKMFSVNIRPIGDDLVFKQMPQSNIQNGGSASLRVDMRNKYNLPMLQFYVTPHVLPSANSSSKRIKSDKESAFKIARSLDELCKIESG